MPQTIDISAIHQPPAFLKVTLYTITFFIVFSFIKSILNVFYSPLSKFPGPKLWAISKLPLIRTMVSGNEARIYAELHQKYGPVVRTGPNQLSCAGDKANLWAIYGHRKGGHSIPSKDVRKFYSGSLNGQPSIITANDLDHARQRKILTHAFSDKAMKEQEPLIKKWGQLLRSKLEEKADGIQEVDMVKYYNFTTFDIMGDLTFSEGLGMLNGSEYSPWVKTIFGSIKNATFFRGLRMHDPVSEWLVDNVLFRSPKVRAMAWEHWTYTTERVNRRLQRTPEHEDLWSKILDKDDTKGGLTPGEHESNASLFMIAGTETTATALSGTTFHLLKNPEKMERLLKEIRVFEDFDDVTIEQLARMKYLDAVLEEGLRMYPPVPIALPRITPMEGIEIDGKYVPGNVTVGVHQYATSRMPMYFKDAYEFHPERHLGDEKYKDDKLDAFEPFSTGPRNCLGRNLAKHEFKILLVAVLLKFDLKLSEESKDWDDQKVYLLWEKKPLLCSLKLTRKA